MKKEELLAKLGGLENAEEVAEYILAENAKEVEQATKAGGTSEELEETRNALEKANKDLAAARAELAQYEKDGEKYIDPEEHKRLKEYETATLAKEKETTRKNAVELLLDEYSVPKALRKVFHRTMGEVEVGEDGKIVGGDKLIAEFKEEYSDLFAPGSAGLGKDGGSGAPSGESDTDKFLKMR